LYIDHHLVDLYQGFQIMAWGSNFVRPQGSEALHRLI